MQTVTVAKKNNLKYKKASRKTSQKIDYELVSQIRRSLEDIKHGRITEWKPGQN